MKAEVSVREDCLIFLYEKCQAVSEVSVREDCLEFFMRNVKSLLRFQQGRIV